MYTTQFSFQSKLYLSVVALQNITLLVLKVLEIPRGLRYFCNIPLPVPNHLLALWKIMILNPVFPDSVEDT